MSCWLHPSPRASEASAFHPISHRLTSLAATGQTPGKEGKGGKERMNGCSSCERADPCGDTPGRSTTAAFCVCASHT